jgi:phenylacetate-CoA ligase
MNIIPFVKSFLQDIPRPVGCIISKIPYHFRPGIGFSYSHYQNEIKDFDDFNLKIKKKYIADKFQRILASSFDIPFYRDLYKSAGIDRDTKIEFEDISKIPVIDKDMLKAISLEERSMKRDGAYIANTGGSSGSTLNFYITPRLIPNEWAHMHTIWKKLGYTQSMLKFGFAGRNLGNSKEIVYDGLRHQYSINVYKNIQNSIQQLDTILSKEKVYYLHGYPSALSEFAVNLKEHAPHLVQKLRKHLKGAFLSSEYPVPMYRDRIEKIFGIPTISWYGHTERAILAWEKKDKFIYYPFQTYGYCEVVPNSDTGGWRLIGTSYNNFASPFIRYDTGDDVEPIVSEEGLLVSFRVRSGRLGEFVVDRNGVKIPLTALIFGRHHPLFDLSLFIQVLQKEDGKITVIITPKQEIPADFIFHDWFDTSGLDMDIDYKIVTNPILSPSGKVNLKVKEIL